MGPDDLLYVRIGTFGYGQWIARFDHRGNTVDFAGDAVTMPKNGKWADTGERIYGGYPRPRAFGKRDVKVLWTGLRNHSNVHERGLYVSPKGYIVAAVSHMDLKWGLKRGVPANTRQRKNVALESYVVVWDSNGRLLTANAVGEMGNGHGVAMDGDGNIYAAMGGRVPAGQKSWDGIVGERLSQSTWGSYGSLLKFQGGRPFPRGTAHYDRKSVPSAAARLDGYRRGPAAIEGAQWIYGGLACQTPDICSCHNTRYDMDYFARHWIPANHLYSVMVLDANGNRIARIGRYGNVDDEGIRFVWPRALCVSDTALYVADVSNRRILKAALAYHVEETVPLGARLTSDASR
jgi:hypothetical protein